MGKPLPDSIYNEQTAPRMGLKLPRGPDPRSFNPAQAAIAAAGRTIFGMGIWTRGDIYDLEGVGLST